MRKLLPLILGLVGLGAGVGAGLALRPEPVAPDRAAVDANGSQIGPSDQADQSANYDESAKEGDTQSDFLKMNNQFVVPVVSEQKVTSLVVLSLGLEMTPGGSAAFYQREPKLRDAFLQVLFDHANTGGFNGVFTEGRKLGNLRRALLEMAQKVMGDQVKDVLVTDILRQDV